jgi:hypothetical protein
VVTCSCDKVKYISESSAIRLGKVSVRGIYFTVMNRLIFVRLGALHLCCADISTYKIVRVSNRYHGAYTLHGTISKTSLVAIHDPRWQTLDPEGFTHCFIQ